MIESTDELGLSELLTASQVDSLNGQWDDDGVWDDVARIAARFWAASSQDDRAIAWHHLLLAVGNFKRQSGRLYPAPVPDTLQDSNRAVFRGAATVPWHKNSVQTIECEDRQTWECLMGVNGGLKGLAVATTTTLLAALWPERHFVFDRRVISAAHGLRLAGGRPGLPDPGADPDAIGPMDMTFDVYETVRQWLSDTERRISESEMAREANEQSRHPRMRLTRIERALYQLDIQVTKERSAATSRTWREYGSELLAYLTKLVPADGKTSRRPPTRKGRDS